MGRVLTVTGEDVMTANAFAAWWDEHHQSGIFVDVLRRDLASRLQARFRQLALVLGDEVLSSDSQWIDAELVVVVRPYLTTDAENQELLQAAGQGDVARVARLLDLPLDPDACDGWALHRAAMFAHLDIVRCLLEAGASKNKALATGSTPLHFAAGGGHVAIVRCLIEAGADTDLADHVGKTPLHWAAGDSHAPAVQVLLEAGADKDKGEEHGKTALHLAAECGHLEVVHVLLQARADTGRTDTCGRAPIEVAQGRRRQEIMLCLQARESQSTQEPAKP